MKDYAILVENLSKRYLLNTNEEQYRTIGNTLWNKFRAAPRRLRSAQKPGAKKGEIWALKNVSFQINPGEMVGIMGHNGAGKSTLLRILSRITLPTEGTARVRGRVGSLLQAGTGFNPELTGRENVYLSGTILGMKKKEIDKKFDQIVDFSGVEQFINTPVKRYSTGMNIRLGFSVSIFLEPDILLVDEVLSVGDAEFRQKSLEKVLELIDQGVSILFVSHDITAVRQFCKRAIILDTGKLVNDGETYKVIEEYVPKFSNVLQPNITTGLDQANRQGTGKAKFSSISYTGIDTGPEQNAFPDQPVEFELIVLAKQNMEINGLSIIFFDISGFRLINAGEIKKLQLEKGANTIKLTIHSLHLKSGTYLLSLWMVGPPEIVLDHISAAAYIDVMPKDGFAIEYVNTYQDKVTSDIDVWVESKAS